MHCIQSILNILEKTDLTFLPSSLLPFFSDLLGNYQRNFMIIKFEGFQFLNRMINMINRFEKEGSKNLINLIKNIFTIHNETLDEEINNNFLNLIKSVEKVEKEVQVILLENIQKILIFLGEEPGLEKERIFDVFIRIVLVNLNSLEYFYIVLINLVLKYLHLLN